MMSNDAGRSHASDTSKMMTEKNNKQLRIFACTANENFNRLFFLKRNEKIEFRKINSK